MHGTNTQSNSAAGRQRTRNVGIGEVGAGEVGAGEVGAGEVGARQVTLGEVDTTQIHLLKLCRQLRA